MARPSVSRERLLETIREINRFGSREDGSVTRLALSEEDAGARGLLKKRMEEARLRVLVDDVGNVYGWRSGEVDGLEPVAFGSHLDTVPGGGMFDGVLGVAAGLEVMRALEEAGVATRRPLVLVNWTNEEGARFTPPLLGSGVVAGVFEREYAWERRDDAGVRFGEALERIGYRGDEKARLVRVGSYLELHIEQGPVLEESGIAIGAVEGIQGAAWWKVEVRGRAAHAGTTPMRRRRDAVRASVGLVEKVAEFAEELRGSGLATVGKLQVWPNAVNVVAERVELWVDVRGRSEDILERGEELLKATVGELTGRGFGADVERVWWSHPVHFDERVVGVVEAAAGARGLSVMRMWSGAAHDAKYLSRLGPTGMIFVPCKGGLSHTKEEDVAEESLVQGAEVLLDAVLTLAAE